MLTPVEERPAAETENDRNILSDVDDEDSSVIIVTASVKIDGLLSRSGSTFSPSSSFLLDSEMVSTKDTSHIQCDSGASPLTQALTVATDESASGETESEEISRFKQEEELIGLVKQKGLLSHSSNDSSLSDTPPPLQLSSFQASPTEEVPSPGLPHSFTRENEGLTGSTRSFQRPVRRPFSKSSSRSFSDHSFNCSDIVVSNQSHKGKKKKLIVSEKYAKYEKFHSPSVSMTDGGSKDSECGIGEESDLQPPQDEGHFQSNAVEEKQGKKIKERDISDEIDAEKELGKKGVMKHNKRLFEVHELSSTSKQCDSGIDDTPVRVRKLSMPPLDDKVSAVDTEPLLQTTFASFESGISDSPISELQSDEVMSLKVHVPKEVKEMSDKRSQQQVIIITPTNSQLQMEDAPEVHPLSNNFSNFSIQRERCTTVPRTFDNPAFSRYARTPIREGKFLGTTESSNEGLRYRSVSMDKLSNYVDNSENTQVDGYCSEFKSPAQPIDRKDANSVVHDRINDERTTFSAFRSKSLDKPDSEENEIYGSHWSDDVDGILDGEMPPMYPVSASLPCSTVRSMAPLSSSEPAYPISISSSPPSMMRQRGRVGKGLKPRSKPVLRVLKGSPSGSSGFSSSPISGPFKRKKRNSREEIRKAFKNEDVVLPDSSGICPSVNVRRSGEGVLRRVRMDSPEAVAKTKQKQLSGGHVKHSQSLENIAGTMRVGNGDNVWSVGISDGIKALPEAEFDLHEVIPVPLDKGKKKEAVSINVPSQFLSERSDDVGGLERRLVEGTVPPVDNSDVSKKRSRLPHFV